jgi:hypothetical protein
MDNIVNHVKELPDHFENRPWLTFLVLVTFGTMILFFLGCGSGSAPEGKKAEKAAKSSGAMKSQAVMPLLNHKEGVVQTGKVKKSVAGQRIEMVPGFTQEELDAKHAAERQKFLAPGTELFPGITREQLEAKHAPERQKFLAPGTELFPGITREQLEAKHAAERQKHLALSADIFPGITQQQLDAKRRQQVKPETMEAFPTSAGK